jgi:hypothetical protein
MEFQLLRRYSILLLALFSSCRKDVTLNLPEYKQKLVVEGSIETGQTAYVLLSVSVPYFGDFDLNKPEESFVKGAVVTVSEGGRTDTLKEADPTKGYLYLGTRIRGEMGKTYLLHITYHGMSFEIASTILTPVKLDRLFFKGEKDSLGFIWQTLTEPPGVGNNYRWFSRRITKDQFYAAPFNSVFNDKFIDGKTFDFAYDRGAQPNEIQKNRDDPERGYYKRGDTVVVKFCSIGQMEYEFWESYYQNKISNSNPFSAPSNIKSMFSDREHILGAFVAYSPSFDTLVVPKR